MTQTKRTFLALIAVLLSPAAATADPITITTNVDGVAAILDVAFSDCSGCGVAFTDETEALAAAGLITAHISANPSNFAMLGLKSDFGAFGIVYDAFFDDVLGIVFLVAGAGTSDAGVTWSIPSTDSIPGAPLNFAYANFTVVDVVGVPEPITLALLGIGLFAMGLARRKVGTKQDPRMAALRTCALKKTFNSG